VNVIDDHLDARAAGSDDVADLAVHVMADTKITNATYDADGGRQLLARAA
jgi:hypothetical protein